MDDDSGVADLGNLHLINGHFRNRFIGDSYHISKAYFLGQCLREYPQMTARNIKVPIQITITIYNVVKSQKSVPSSVVFG